MGIIGGELLSVNGFLAQAPYHSDVVTLADGGFVLAWSGTTAGGTADVTLRVFNADGSLRSSVDIPANAHLAGEQAMPRLTSLAGGGFAVVWAGQTAGDEAGIAFRIFDANGAPQSATDTLVNVGTEGSQSAPQLTSLADGGLVVAWQTAASGDTPSVLSLRIFDKDGKASSGDQDIRLDVASAGSFSIAALVGGGFVVVHDGSASEDGGVSPVRMRIFDAAGSVKKDAIVPIFAGDGASQAHPVVTALADGGFVVAWDGERNGDSAGISLQIFDPDGTARANTDFSVNEHARGDQRGPLVTALKDGGFVVLWGGETAHDEAGLAMQVYNPDGKTRMAGDIPVNAGTDGLQGDPFVVALAGGGFAVAWTTQGDDGYSVSLRVFNASGAARMAVDEPVAKASALVQGAPKIAALDDGGLALSWQASEDDGVHLYEKVYRAVNDAPTGESKTLHVKEDSPYVFKAEDFGFRDANGDVLKAVHISSVPANGTLTLGGRPVVPGQMISASDIEAGKLAWKATANLNGIALGALTFNVVDTGGTDFDGRDTDPITRKLTLDVAPVNDNPKARALSTSTYENAIYKVEVKDAAVDVDRDELSMINARIVSGFGSVMIDAKKMLIYNPTVGPNQNIGDGESRKVVISYTVSDGKGGTTTATITLTVMGISPDLFSGTSGNDKLTGSIHGDLMYGKGGNDTLIGGKGNDLIDGGSGIDTLKGESGGDTYMVDDARDVVIEAANAGTDTVQASCSYTLGANIEKLFLLGSGKYGGTGNALANTITGNAAANTLKGLGGNDLLLGGGGNDRLEGGDGNDTLDGGAGSDRLCGGHGNDLYMVSAGDTVVELRGEGTDTVQAGCSYTLSDNVERLLLTGSGNHAGTGNALSNRITGNAGANLLKGMDGSDVLDGGSGSDRLYGGNGNDTLEGGAGTDRLSGGAGRDVFVFRKVSDTTVSSGGRDTVLDFSSSDGDLIDLRGIDARAATSADNAFLFIGKSGFGKHAGELRYQKSGSDTLLSGDVDGDGKADFSILFSGAHTFGKADFLL